MHSQHSTYCTCTCTTIHGKGSLDLQVKNEHYWLTREAYLCTSAPTEPWNSVSWECSRDRSGRTNEDCSSPAVGCAGCGVGSNETAALDWSATDGLVVMKSVLVSSGNTLRSIRGCTEIKSNYKYMYKMEVLVYCTYVCTYMYMCTCTVGRLKPNMIIPSFVELGFWLVNDDYHI